MVFIYLNEVSLTISLWADSYVRVDLREGWKSTRDGGTKRQRFLGLLVASHICKPKQAPNGCREERSTRKKREVGKRLDRSHMEEEDGSRSEDEDEDSGKEVENQPITALGFFLVC
ncbi:hypothetical protein L1887_13593 [Cichorium endivia]|nr:hypothetical protein L1887_13593 [Cichorium endivia]